MKFSILIFAIYLAFAPAYSDDQTPETSPDTQNFVKRWWYATRNNFSKIYNEGNNDLYLTGYAYHDRWTYTKEKLRDLNEGAYGGGFGRSLINENGNTEMLYLMAHLDSHSDVQINAGYAWAKKFSIAGDVKVGFGYTAFLVSRSDFAGHFPLPFALPLVSLDIDNLSIMGIIIPKLNDGINNGNVLFLFAKFTWERNKNL